MGLAVASQYEVALLLGAGRTIGLARILASHHFQDCYDAMELARRCQLLRGPSLLSLEDSQGWIETVPHLNRGGTPHSPSS
jgi:hypothetical protein